MTFRRRHAIWISLLAIAGIAAWWTLRAKTLSTEACADFEWFSTLGFPDVSNYACVRVSTGETEQRGYGPPSNVRMIAFLLTNTAETFTVLTPGLETKTFTNAPADDDADAACVGFEPVDLQATARANLKLLKNPPPDFDYEEGSRFGNEIPGDIEVFAFAWACWRHGLNSEASQIYAEAIEFPRQHQPRRRHLTLRKVWENSRDYVSELWENWRPGHPKHLPPPPFRETLERVLAETVISRSLQSYRQGTVDRPQLVTFFEDILAKYPRYQEEGIIRTNVEILQRMIMEDANHRKIDPATLEQLPVEDRVRELIFQLRNQSGFPHWPGWYFPDDDPDDPPTQPETPADRLAALGLSAVPQLIETLDSPDLSRADAEYHRRRGAWDLFMVDDIAADIIEGLSGRSLGNQSLRKDTAVKWWAEVQAKGEKQTLVDGVAAGGDSAQRQIGRLRRLYPDAAMEALSRGVQSTTNDYVRYVLITSAASMTNSSAVELLRDQILHAPGLDERVAAANGLVKHDRDAAITAMIQEWRKLTDSREGAIDGANNLVRFLADCDSESAIRALEDKFGSHPAELRFGVLDCVGNTNNFSEPDVAKPAPSTLAAFERLLASALNDTEEYLNANDTRGGKAYWEPRISDIAAQGLADRWPEHYQFDISANLRTRERQRIECLNVWRKSLDLAALPLPTPLTTRVSSNRATQVTVVDWGAVKPPNKSIEAFASRLNGKPLLTDDFVTLLTACASQLKNGQAGFTLCAFKDEDLTGVRIVFSPAARPPPTADSTAPSSRDWDVQRLVLFGNRCLMNSSGSNTPEMLAGAEWWSDLEEALDRVLAAPAATPITISIHITPEDLGPQNSIPRPPRVVY